MKFSTKTELLEYVMGLADANSKSLSDLDLDIKVLGSEAPKTAITEYKEIGILSMSNAPRVKAKVTNGEQNVLFVESFDVIPNSCGTGKIVFADRTMWMNMCEMEGECHISLNLDIDGKSLYNKPFLVKTKTLNESVEESYDMILSDSLLN
jgi:Tfp pilus assembly PilM family ATPase